MNKARKGSRDADVRPSKRGRFPLDMSVVILVYRTNT